MGRKAYYKPKPESLLPTLGSVRSSRTSRVGTSMVREPNLVFKALQVTQTMEGREGVFRKKL